MKKLSVLLAVLLAATMLLGLCACGEQPVDNSDATPSTTTTTTTAPVDDGKETYTVTVLNEQGEAIVGAMVQICAELCIPTVTDANGVATWKVEEKEYKVSFLSAPEGYAVEEAYYFDDDAKEMTITLKAA